MEPAKNSRNRLQIWSFHYSTVFIVSLIILTCIQISAVHAGQVTLAWDPVSSPSVSGYKIYYGTSSRSYSSVSDVGLATTYTIGNLAEGTLFFFAATSYESSGKESDFSEEISFYIPANRPPEAQDSTFTVQQGGEFNGILVARDADGDNLTFKITAQPSNGALSLLDSTTGAFRYVPSPAAAGTDTFNFVASDGKKDSNTATVSITILSANHPPVAVDDVAVTEANTPVAIPVLTNDTDCDGDTLSLLAAGQGANGSVSVDKNSVIYTPKQDFSGNDSFSYTVSDVHGATAVGTVSVTVTKPNKAPVAYNQSISTFKATPVSGKLSASDPDGDTVTYSIVAGPKMGNLTLSNSNTGTFTYEPNSNATGTDSFTFKARDGKLDSNIATVTVSINQPVNIYIEAENGTIVSPMKRVYSTTASGGKYIYVPNGSGNLTDPTVQKGYARYTFSVPSAGTYRIWGRIMADKTNDNSFFVSVDYAGYIVWHTALGGKDTWVWDHVSENDKSGPVAFELGAGQHTLIIKQMEDGAKLDRILITSQASPWSETVYSDAEDGSISGWEIYDADPSGAQILNVFDENRESNVTEFWGAHIDNGYQLLTPEFGPWLNPSQFVIEWSAAYSESYMIFVGVETSAGYRYLQYSPANSDLLGTGTVVQFGLGNGTVDGKWHRYVRDLQSDLRKALPGASIIRVNSFSIRGNGRVDDVKLRGSL